MKMIFVGMSKNSIKYDNRTEKQSLHDVSQLLIEVLHSGPHARQRLLSVGNFAPQG